MSSDLLVTTIPYVGIIIASEIGFAYAGYISLSVWRGLSVPIYRSRALWTGILALSIGLATPGTSNITAIFPAVYHDIVATLVYIFLYPAVILGLFVWIDRTVATIIRMDYLRRDLARWSSLRWVYWAINGLQFILYYLGYFINLGTFFNSSSIANAAGLVYLFSLLIPATYGAVALLVGSRRTANLTFRSHVKWLGYAIGGIIIISVVSQLTANIVIGAVPALLISYSFYKIARYLVPVGRLTTGAS